jgi:hypothetical protein
MLTPVEFLLARVTDLEQVAREATPGPWVRYSRDFREQRSPGAQQYGRS